MREGSQSRRLPPEVLTDTEVSALMRACSRHAPTGLRNRFNVKNAVRNQYTIALG